MITSDDVNTYRGDAQLPHAGPAPNVLPEASTLCQGDCSNTGVSTRNAPYKTGHDPVHPKPPTPPPERHWYALRTTYGREKKAYDYIIEHKGKAFYPTIKTEKIINGKKKLVEVSRLPNIFFAYGTEEELQFFVYDNINLPFLRFYYKHTHLGGHILRTPLIVPNSQIRSLQIICEADTAIDTIITSEMVQKFQTGEKVRITEGDFKGVEGIVARYHGQRRVGIVIDGLLTATTAYIPSAFLEKTNI